MREMLPWVKLPSTWIEHGGLKSFRWLRGQGAGEIAALMALLAIAHYSSRDTAIARVTYNELTDAISVSRAKLSEGLDILRQRNLIEFEPEGRSTYRLNGFEEDGRWCQIPAKPLYDAGGAITAFREFRLRKSSELNALKAYLTFAARRDRKTNHAHITYEQIKEYSGIQEENIKSALTILAINGLVFVEQRERGDDYGYSNAYRLNYIDSRRHQGTVGRQMGDDFYSMS